MTMNGDYNKDYRAPEDAGIKHRGVITDIQNEDRFSPVNTFAFSPMSQEYLSLDNAILLILVARLAKSDPKGLAKLMAKYMDDVTGLLGKIADAAKAHPITALNAGTMYAVTAHRFGVITDSGYLKIVDQIKSIIDKLILINFAGVAMDGLSVLVEGSKVGAEGAAAGLPALLSLVKR
jgi:hypothetical protein